MARNRTLMSVQLRAANRQRLCQARRQALFATRTKLLEIQGTARSYGVAPDGQRFLVANATAGITVGGYYGGPQLAHGI